MLTLIIPTRNAEASLKKTLPRLRGRRLIVSDSGSEDATMELAIDADATLCFGSAGRGPQFARGAALANLRGSDWFLFLHADAQLSSNWQSEVEHHISAYPDSVGYFRYGRQGDGFWPWLQKTLVSLRCWAWKLPYGDQGLLISARAYEAIGGYSDLPLFEDVDIMNRLKAGLGRSNIRPLGAFVVTDTSAYETQGWWKRGWRNFQLMRAFQRGDSVSQLMQRYYND
ncbi:glycosyltransferase [Litorimonas haliclonae]|uniref:glycosyltransferase n=1 Tax=Litorimonas haliclonae TaxID=2081977 RepID=UPI0039EE4C95